MLSPAQEALVRAAVDLATNAHDGAAHTVAAALLTRSGRVVTGLNTGHPFLGGSCAELTALANLAALRTDPEDHRSEPDRPVTTVAAYGLTGEVVPPCGRCRQVLFDLDPEINSVVPGPDGLLTLPIRELLPHAYDWRTVKGRTVKGRTVKGRTVKGRTVKGRTVEGGTVDGGLGSPS